MTFKKFYREHCLRHTRLYPGVLETLRHFRGKKMAVVTNKPVKISAYMLDQLGLSSYFDVLIGGDSLPNKKPHPEPCLSALKTLRISIQNASSWSVIVRMISSPAGPPGRTPAG